MKVEHFHFKERKKHALYLLASTTADVLKKTPKFKLKSTEKCNDITNMAILYTYVRQGKKQKFKNLTPKTSDKIYCFCVDNLLTDN